MSRPLTTPQPSRRPPLRVVDDLRDSPNVPAWLVDVARRLADAEDRWASRAWYDPERRVYEQLVETDAYDAWLVGWAPGQAIAAHDHGMSSGVVIVTAGQLINTEWSNQGTPVSRTLSPGDAPFTVDAGQAHALANLGAVSATSIHVYSPPLRTMRWFAGDTSGLRGVGERAVRHESSHDRSVETLLGEARARLHRLVPEQARLAAATGALLVDIRPEACRRADGEIPGALVVERNVLEWRLDPTSPDRLPEVRGHDTAIVLFCNEGYSSSLAAAGLHDLGLRNATDVDGGFRAWKQAGLPVVRSRHAGSDEHRGLG